MSINNLSPRVDQDILSVIVPYTVRRSISPDSRLIGCNLYLTVNCQCVNPLTGLTAFSNPVNPSFYGIRDSFRGGTGRLQRDGPGKVLGTLGTTTHFSSRYSVPPNTPYGVQGEKIFGGVPPEYYSLLASLKKASRNFARALLSSLVLKSDRFLWLSDAAPV